MFTGGFEELFCLGLVLGTTFTCMKHNPTRSRQMSVAGWLGLSCVIECEKNETEMAKTRYVVSRRVVTCCL